MSFSSHRLARFVPASLSLTLFAGMLSGCEQPSPHDQEVANYNTISGYTNDNASLNTAAPYFCRTETMVQSIMKKYNLTVDTNTEALSIPKEEFIQNILTAEISPKPSKTDLAVRKVAAAALYDDTNEYVTTKFLIARNLTVGASPDAQPENVSRLIVIANSIKKSDDFINNPNLITTLARTPKMEAPTTINNQNSQPNGTTKDDKDNYESMRNVSTGVSLLASLLDILKDLLEGLASVEYPQQLPTMNAPKPIVVATLGNSDTKAPNPASRIASQPVLGV